MTEKRFTFEIKTRGNKAYTQWYDDGKPINSAETVVDLLNELNDENKKLKQVNEMLQMDFTMTERNLMEENEQLKEEIAKQKFTKRMMRDNIKSYERAIKRLRKSYEKFDEMRLDRIRFLEKRLKKNGLSIYVNGCGDLE